MKISVSRYLAVAFLTMPRRTHSQNTLAASQSSAGHIVRTLLIDTVKSVNRSHKTLREQWIQYVSIFSKPSGQYSHASLDPSTYPNKFLLYFLHYVNEEDLSMIGERDFVERGAAGHPEPFPTRLQEVSMVNEQKYVNLVLILGQTWPLASEIDLVQMLETRRCTVKTMGVSLQTVANSANIVNSLVQALDNGKLARL